MTLPKNEEKFLFDAPAQHVRLYLILLPAKSAREEGCIYELSSSGRPPHRQYV